MLNKDSVSFKETILLKIKIRITQLNLVLFAIYIFLGYLFWIDINRIYDLMGYDSSLLAEKKFYLVVIIFSFFLCTAFKNHLLKKVKRNFIIAVSEINNSKTILHFLNGNKLLLERNKKIIVKKKWDYWSSFFFYNSFFIFWDKGLQNMYQILMGDQKFYFMPEYFEDTSMAYSFLKELDSNSEI